jgi:hypothetical protein
MQRSRHGRLASKTNGEERWLKRTSRLKMPSTLSIDTPAEVLEML